jgi:signal transduction histidine kinase
LYLGSKSRYADALQVLYKILPEAEKYKDTLNTGLALNTIGSVEIARNQTRDALTWVKRAVDLVGDQPAYYQVLAPAYVNAGNAYTAMGNYDSGLYFIQKALPICRAIENLNYIATSLRIQSNNYIQNGRIKEAEAALLEMIAIRQKTSPASIIVEDNLQLANFYANSGQLEKAIQLCRKNLAQGSIILNNGDSNAVFTNDPKIRLNFLEALSGYYKQGGKTKEYLTSLEELLSAKDSFYEANSAKIIAELQTQYELKNKENTILKQKYDLQRKNFLFYVTLIISVILLFSALLGFINFRRKQQQKAKAMLDEERILSIAAVKNAEEKERVRIASDLHDNLGAYAASLAANTGYLYFPEVDNQTQVAIDELKKNASAIVSQLNDTIWVLKKEALPLTAISDRIKKFILQISGSYREVVLDVVEEIQDDILLPSSSAFHLYRVLQEAINNALKHSKGSNVQVLINAANGKWNIHVKDDGIGMSDRLNMINGLGLQNMQDRCMEAGWQITWNGQNGGTDITITPTTN